MKARIAIVVLSLWVIAIFAFHAAGRSPYSYGWALFNQPASRLLGTVVNPDSIGVVPVVMFFYDDEQPSNWHNSPNFRLPLHGFVVATLAAFTRSYLASNDLANLGAMILLIVVAVKLTQRYALPLVPVTVALAAIATLPFVVTYIGQPLHHTVGTVINYLCVLAAFSMDEDDLRRPLIAGLIVAIVILNYDPYIFAAALAIWILLVVRFRRVRDVIVFIVVALAPVILWTQFIRYVSADRLSRITEKAVIQPILHGWGEFVRHPIANALQPFLAAHIGLHVGTHLILAEIYWPLLLVCIAGLWRLGDDIPRTHRAVLLALLVLTFVVHQIGTAAFDWENNPRRALPVVLAVGVAYAWVAARLWSDRRWRAAFIIVLALCAAVAFADVLVDSPAITYLSTGQAVRENPKDAVTKIEKLRLTPESLPSLMHDETPKWHDMRTAHPVTLHGARRFLFGQAFNAFFCCALLWLLARAKLLPKLSPTIAAIVWAASAVRFF